MPLLTVQANSNDELSLSFTAGQCLRSILDSTAMRVRSGCRGTGACGLCRIQILQGSGNLPTDNERIQLSEEQLAAGIRLACQFLPTEDVVVQLLNPAPPSNWKGLGQKILRPASRQNPSRTFPVSTSCPLGIAVDLGTTNISLSLYDLLTGKRLTERHGINPQAVFGADIMTRLVAAAESADIAGKMSKAILAALAEALHDIGSREGVDLRQVIYLAVVGNTAMLTLLTGKNHELLLRPEMWEKTILCRCEQPANWAEHLGIHPEASMEVIPPLAGFVGSDLLVGVLAMRLAGHSAPALFIDFGTNTEIALWDGHQLLVTSAAGGPAFESCGISCGMPAEPGAIYRVTDQGSGALTFAVIDEISPARGLCGSGFVDLVACLCKKGMISATGKFLSGTGVTEYVLPLPATALRLSKRDIDMMQRAKAAVAAGVSVLLEKAGLRTADLHRVCLAGAFGKYIRIANAKAIGLLPDINEKYFELCGNTALAGCEDFLLSSDAASRLESLRSTARLINLSSIPDFDELFFDNLFFRPMTKG